MAEPADLPALPLEGLTPPRRASVLDAAADLLDMRFARELVFEPEHAAQAQRQILLERRAEIVLPSPPLDEMPPG